jgi:hypothetical protein
MKSYIQQLLRENLNNRIDEVPVKRRDLKKFHQLLEKKIRVGDNITKKLNRVNSPLAKNVLRFLNSDDIKDEANVDYVDYDKKNEKLFTLGYTDQRGGAKQRLMKFQKLLSYLGGDLNSIKGYEVEELIYHLKSADLDDLKLVSGEKIRWAYHCENYDEGATMGSCMRHGYTQKYLSIYTENPNQVKCLVLFNPENGKVRGRALIWTCDDGSKFMDRVYVINEKYRVEFNQFAEENNIITTHPLDDVTLDNGGEYEYYPYMDTFQYYTPDTGVLSDDDGELTLQDTNGGDSTGEFSEYHQTHIPEDEAVYVEHMESIMYDHECTYSEVEEGWVYLESDDIIEITKGYHKFEYALEENTRILIDDEITHVDEAIYLDKGEHEGEYVHEDDVVVDWEGYDIWREELEDITAGKHYGKYVHITEAVFVYDEVEGHEEVFTTDDDLTEYEESDRYTVTIGKD